MTSHHKLRGRQADVPSLAAPAATRRLNWWLQAVMDAFYDARLTWDLDRDAYSKGYATKAAEYADRHPCPQLKRFLIAHSYKHLAVAA